MENLYLIQLIGVILTIAGLLALMASTHLFGTPLSPGDRRRASDEWNRRRNAYRLPINLETITSLLFFLGGLGVLAWSRFNYCEFLVFWVPSVPETVRLFLSCR
jgi:hypothetical protein